jgi:hypothetical protein
MSDCGCGSCSTKAVVLTASTLVIMGYMLKDLLQLRTSHVIIGSVVGAVSAFSIYKLISYVDTKDDPFYTYEKENSITEIETACDQDFTWEV